jgi:hypothetical protein
MDWVKRNLYFVIGGAVSIILLGLAGWYGYSKYDENNQKWEALNKQYQDLKVFSGEPVHPGSGAVNNIQTAKEFRTNCLNFVRHATNYFVRIAPIPSLPKITDRDFSFALTHSIDQLRRDATNASVSLPPDCEFSFLAQSRKTVFAPESVDPMSVQLGEVKAICDVLFQAKVNSLDSLRRERSTDDAAGNATDYLADKSITNEMAILSPYEVVFRCFTPELASVISTFASSSNGIVVKTMDVEQAGAATIDPTTGTVMQPQMTPQPGTIPGYPGRYPTYNPDGGRPNFPPPGATAASPGGTAPRRGALPIVLDDKKLKVTMALTVVKLLPPK